MFKGCPAFSILSNKNFIIHLVRHTSAIKVTFLNAMPIQIVSILFGHTKPTRRKPTLG